MAAQDMQLYHYRTEPTESSVDISQDTLITHVKTRTFLFAIILLSVLILTALLFLYARWVCRYQHHHFPTTQHFNSHAPPARSRAGLNPVSISSLPITLYRESNVLNGSGAECSICLGVFEDGEKIKVLPRCGHCFHCDCVDEWLLARSSCPLCRASLLDSVHVVEVNSTVSN